MSDVLWSTKHRIQALFAHLEEMRWDDSASKRIYTRYLQSYRADTDDMMRSLDELYMELQLIHTQVANTMARVKEAHEASTSLEHHHKYAQGEMRHAEQEYEHARRLENAARLKIPQIQKWISMANEAGR